MRWLSIPRRRPRIEVDREPFEAQRLMLEDLARRLDERDARRRRPRSRRGAAVVVIAALLTTGAASAVTAAVVLDVSLGVASLDRILKVEQDNATPLTPRPAIAEGSVSPPVAVAAANGADGALAAAFGDRRRGLCITTLVRSERPLVSGETDCADVRPALKYLQERPVIATGLIMGPTTAVWGFARADVLGMEVRAPTGPKVNVALQSRPWAPRTLPGTRPIRLFVGAYHLTDLLPEGLIDGGLADRAINLTAYRARVFLRDGRTIEQSLR